MKEVKKIICEIDFSGPIKWRFNSWNGEFLGGDQDLNEVTERVELECVGCIGESDGSGFPQNKELGFFLIRDKENRYAVCCGQTYIHDYKRFREFEALGYRKGEYVSKYTEKRLDTRMAGKREYSYLDIPDKHIKFWCRGCGACERLNFI